MTHEEWLKNKQTYIGGSEAAAILGIGKYGSPLAVYLNKIGEGIEVEDNEKMYWGRELEALVIREYTKRTGIETVHNTEYAVAHFNDFIACTPDGIAHCPTRGKGVVEAKTASEYMSSEWTDDSCPDQYVIQLYHNMACCSTKWGALVALIGGNKFVYREFEWDQELINLIIKKETDFWKNNVEKRIPPDPTGSSLDLLGKLYKKDNGTSVTLASDNIGKAIASYLDAKTHLEAYTKQKEDSEAIIKSAMGEASKGIYQGADGTTWGISWGTVKGRVGFDSKQFEKDHPDMYLKYMKQGADYRRFMVKEKKAQITSAKRAMIGG